MGIYLNPGNQGFAESLNSQIYVDKTGLISYTNRVIGTAQKYICVSRPRRFGKTMAAGMLTAYYGRECESGELFEGLAIEKDVSFKKHLNQYDVIFLNMQNFLSRAKSADSFVLFLQECVLKDLAKAYPDFAGLWEQSDLLTALEEVYNVNQKGFIFIIDEWDCILGKKARFESADRLSGFPARSVERQILCQAGLYDGNFTCKKIRNTFGSEYVR